MPDDYLIHLNFLPVTGPIPGYAVYRKLRDDGASTKPQDINVRAYSLPIQAANLEQRAQYWVSTAAAGGYEEFSTQPEFNNDLTKWAMFNALCVKAKANLLPAQFWISDRTFQPEIHFIMKSHPEGDEQLIVQPYRLRANGKFGWITDFHFRKKDDVVFSRKIQQLSLSLDKHFRRNLDYYVDRLGKISTFVRELRNILLEVRLPGAEASSFFSPEFEPIPATRLRSRIYVFGGNREARSQFTGLRDFGPLKPVTNIPHLLFVFREQDRQAARSLAMALRGTRPKERFSFPGFDPLFHTALQIDSNPVVIPDFSEASMQTALLRAKAITGMTVPVVVLPEEDKSAYLNHKAVFAHAGMATQVCTLEVIQDESALKWATANIALQIFCKAGGFPWKVRQSSERSLILGISQSHKIKNEGGHNQIDRHFAFSVLTDSSGLFQKIQVLGDASSEVDYLNQFRESLRTLLVQYSSEFSRVVIHTSFKLKHREIDQIQKVVEETAASEVGQKTSFAVVKVNNRTRFFGANRNVNSLVPFEGTCVKLGHSEYLVWFEGIFSDKPTVTKAFPGPTHLQFLRLNDEKQIAEDALLQELMNLSGANWRGFNAKSAPVSVFYCHLVADLVHDFHDRNLPLPAVEGLQPWFL
jgi:Piwi domain